jgi:uncharacterized membrane protein
MPFLPRILGLVCITCPGYLVGAIVLGMYCYLITGLSHCEHCNLSIYNLEIWNCQNNPLTILCYTVQTSSWVPLTGSCGSLLNSDTSCSPTWATLNAIELVACVLAALAA